MKVSLNWVKRYTASDLPVSALIEKIGAQLGAVDEVVDLGARYKGVVVARVVTTQKHPNADRLTICMINDGKVVKGFKRDKKGLVQVVCGAPNVAAGQLVAWIPPGVAVPSTFDKEPFVLEAKELRGELSNGMIASAKELAIGDSHEGILVIDEPARPGQAFAKVYELDDFIVDIENKMFTHRPDCFGMLGVAREVAGIQRKKFKSPAWYKADAAVPTGKGPQIKVLNSVPKLVPRFSALTISGVDVKPSHTALQTYLSRLGVKPINNVVDATNFVMLLTGQPLHAYDLDKLGTGTLGVRLSKSGETLKLIGGKDIKLKSGAIVITDSQKPIGLGGVMGGAGTEVDENTKNIVLESANFDMNLTRKTAFEYGLFTDAATRFTKGQSPYQTLAALTRTAEKIKKRAGGKPGKLVDNKHLIPKNRSVHVPAQFINERLGLDLSSAEMKHLLENVEFKVGRERGKLSVMPPFWRTDIEITEDVVEEIGRLYGYDHLPIVLPRRETLAARTDPMLGLKSRIREILKAGGANEALTYSFVDSALMEKAGQDPENAFHIRNALSPELQYYRQGITPSLLDKIHGNIKQGYDEFALFEIGKIHHKGLRDAEGLPAEPNRLALVVASSGAKAGAAYYWAKQVCEYLFGELNISSGYRPIIKETSDKALYYELPRTSEVMVGDKVVGRVGEFKPSVSDAFKLPKYCAGFSLHLDDLLPFIGAPQYRPLNRYPELEQDICLRTTHNLSYAKLDKFIGTYLAKAATGKGYISSIKPLDIFQRPNDRGHKQTTWRITLSHPERTLTTEEANKFLDGLAAEAKNKLNAERI